MISASLSITRDGETIGLVVRGIAHTPGVRGDVELVSVHLDARDEPEWTGEPLSDAEYERAIEALWGASLQTDPRPQRFVCPDCGYGVKADEDGCCVTCGRDCAIVIVVDEPEDMAREALADRIDRAHEAWKERRLERDLGR